MTAQDWKDKMSACFRNFGGIVHGVSVPTSTPMRFKPAINTEGALYVSIYKGGSSQPFYSLPLDEWAEWAAEYVTTYTRPPI